MPLDPVFIAFATIFAFLALASILFADAEYRANGSIHHSSLIAMVFLASATGINLALIFR